MKIQDILLASNVKRWGIVNTIGTQSVAEHSFNVTMIARAIAAELNMKDECIIKYALDHDLDEIFTGDIPTPAKERLNIGRSYNGKSYGNLSSEEAMVVKLADMIDGLYFIIDNQIGRHAHIVTESMISKYEQYCDLIAGTHAHIVKAANKITNQITCEVYEAEKRERG